jgi:hypothetical protein
LSVFTAAATPSSSPAPNARARLTAESSAAWRNSALPSKPTLASRQSSFLSLVMMSVPGPLRQSRASAQSGEKEAVTIQFWTHDQNYIDFFTARAAELTESADSAYAYELKIAQAPTTDLVTTAPSPTLAPVSTTTGPTSTAAGSTSVPSATNAGALPGA